MSFLIMLQGTVTMNNDFDGKRVIALKLTNKSTTRLLEAYPNDCENYPLNDETGEFRAHTKYNVSVYEDGETSSIDVSEIGAGTLVIAQVKISEGKYMKKKYKTAYLRSINILGECKENVPYNPFDDYNEVE